MPINAPFVEITLDDKEGRSNEASPARISLKQNVGLIRTMEGVSSEIGMQYVAAALDMHYQGRDPKAVVAEVRKAVLDPAKMTVRVNLQTGSIETRAVTKTP